MAIKKPIKKWLLLVFLLITSPTVITRMAYAATGADDVKVTLSLKSVSVKEFFDILKTKTGLSFVYNTDQVKALGTITVTAENEPVSGLLTRVLAKGGLSYNINDKIVTILTPKKANKRVVSGTVVDDDGFPIMGAGVVISELKIYVGTDMDGHYKVEVPNNTAAQIRFSFVGMEPYVYKLTAGIGDISHNVTLKSKSQLKEVVVTGIFTRSAGSFTGSASTITGQELQKVGNQNVLQSLKNIDPTIYMPDNLLSGSDPNALPDISMRGTSSFPTEGNTSLRGQYGNRPNQPLFILDGFETSIETIMDLDMNRIESLTILKDASAKALYGSKAANGVIVIETKKLLGNEQRVTYNGGVTIEMPDLTSYNLLTDSSRKLEVETLDGAYTARTRMNQEYLTALYNSRKKLALEGLNTYWLAKPLRTGVGHKHNLSVELGDAKSLRNTIDFMYNKVAGAMIGSDRTTISATANVSYRKDNLTFRNILTVASNRGEDSPYGTFSDYVKMNPYWQATDAKGNVLRWAEAGIPNPMYDAVIGTTSTTEYTQITNNFYTEWQMTPSLKSVLRFGVNRKLFEANKFLPADHSFFAGYSASQNERKGRYTLENGKSGQFSGDFNINYNKSVGKHALFGNAGAFLSETTNSAFVHVAEGFSNTEVADITFAKQYAENTRPTGGSSINREASFLLSLSYSYDNRYLLDANVRQSASSLYGANNRWATSWSLGTGWNIHNESWMKSFDKIQQLKLRGSVGLTGNQNFSTNSAIATYMYYTGVLYGGLTGAYLNNMPNPNLKWEQKLDMNAGLDVRVGGFSLSLDAYIADTKNMLTDLTIPNSTGFSIVKDNLGLVRNSGFEIKASYMALRSNNGFLNLYGSVAHNKNYIVRLSDSLKEYNETLMKNSTVGTASRPLPLYVDGRSMTTIWAVPSAGIDPGRGQEIFIKRDGSLTYDYDPADLSPVGDTAPKLRGNMGFNAEYKGFGLNATFTFLWGGQLYNTTLVDRVENADITYNVDARLADGRWRTPGQVTKYKKFDSAMKTRPTTRFVQDRNELHVSSLTLYYDLPSKLYKPMGLKRMRVSMLMNDLLTFSSIDIERGTSYPFSRKVSFTLTTTF